MCGSCNGGSRTNRGSSSGCFGRCPQQYCSCPLPISCCDVMGSKFWNAAPSVWPCNPTVTEPERNCCQRRFVPFSTCDCGPPPSCCCNVSLCTPRCPPSSCELHKNITCYL